MFLSVYCSYLFTRFSLWLMNFCFTQNYNRVSRKPDTDYINEHIFFLMYIKSNAFGVAWSLLVNYVHAAQISHSLLRMFEVPNFFPEGSPFCGNIEIVPSAPSLIESVSGLTDHTDTTQDGNHASLYISESLLLRSNSSSSGVTNPIEGCILQPSSGL